MLVQRIWYQINIEVVRTNSVLVTHDNERDNGTHKDSKVSFKSFLSWPSLPSFHDDFSVSFWGDSVW